MDTPAIRVLIADDDVLVVESIRDMLKRIHCVAAGEAVNGQQAVEMTQALQPDVVLMDIRMPEMDGIEAAQLIQQQCPTPVVLLTAYQTPELVARASAAGVSAYLDKSASERELERAIAIAIARFADLMELRRLNGKLEWLVRDTYHRVKNNLMVIESLLKLQANAIRDPEARKPLQESRLRVNAMLLIHEYLHNSSDLTRVEVAPYIRKLAVELFHAYKPPQTTIEFAVNVGQVSLSADAATSCGMIINELISNALKHAFEGRQRGRLSVTLDQKQEKYVLAVSDDGAGLPAGVNFENLNSLGMQIVRAKVKDLNGTLDIERRDGTTFRITFASPGSPAEKAA